MSASTTPNSEQPVPTNGSYRPLPQGKHDLELAEIRKAAHDLSERLDTTIANIKKGTFP